MSTHRLLYRCETASNGGGWGANPKTGAPSEGEKFRALAEEQAALRRVATLVARRSPPEQVFAAATDEVAQLLGVPFAHLGRYEGDDTVTFVAASGNGALPVGTRLALGGENACTMVAQSGLAARIESYVDATGAIAAVARERRIGLSIGAPVVVEGRLWGVMVIGSGEGQRPPLNVEARLGDFTELLATAIANAEGRTELARLAEDQAALGRVATLVAHGAAPHEVFAAVTREVGLLLGASLAGMGRYGTADRVTVLAAWDAEGEQHQVVSSPWPLKGGDLASMVFRTGQSVRIESYEGVPGPIAAFVRDELGIASSVASPIVVEGRLWGVLFLHAKQPDRSFTRDAESRLVGFTELVAAAIANAESRTGLAQLAEEQAALNRVATLVARGVESGEVLRAATEEVARLLDVEFAGLGRYESDGTLTIVASWGRAVDFVPVRSRWNIGGRDIGTLVFETGRPARINSHAGAPGRLSRAAGQRGVHSSVGAPIIVEGRLWGVMGAASSGGEPLPLDTEARLANFTELLATAIANAESRGEINASRLRIVAAG